MRGLGGCMEIHKHTTLAIAVCIGLFSFLSSLIISKYGPEWLVMSIGLFSIALVSTSLILLWNSMAGDERYSGDDIEEAGPATQD